MYYYAPTRTPMHTEESDISQALSIVQPLRLPEDTYQVERPCGVDTLLFVH